MVASFFPRLVFAAPSAQGITTQGGRNAIEPVFDASLPTERMEVLVRTEKGLLSEVFCQPVILSQATQITVNGTAKVSIESSNILNWLHTIVLFHKENIQRKQG